MLILEITAGVCLGILACPVLWLLATTITHWYREQRWWRAYRKHERMVQDLSRRYSRHLLEEAGFKRTAALENARGTVQQLLLPVVDPVRMNAELTRQLGDRPVPPTAATTTPSL